ncbi:MAG: hypothetical protein JRJ84_10465 [Deltaproteobacteria bacterium]|nr:hypothetical protein [Deltaproteobacteria bacterium]
MEGFGFEWAFFNHRVSHLTFGVEGDAARVSVVGGTSTTGIDPVLPEQCDPDTCGELPFTDSAVVEVRWGRATSRKVHFARATATVVATAEGSTEALEVPLDRKGKGELIAVIAGFTLDTDYPLSGGEACYDPAYGWHPRRIAIELGEPELSSDGRSAVLDVTGWFTAGNSLEDERQCVDEVAAEAQVPIDVDVLVVVGNGSIGTAQASHEETYSYGCTSFPCLSPDPQPDPDLSVRPLDLFELEAPLVGWSRFDFQFHTDDPGDRGAYLRTVSVDADLAGGTASGHATNYSPATQLSGFDYLFSGTVRAMDVDGELERGVVEDTVTVDLKEDGTPVIHELPL